MHYRLYVYTYIPIIPALLIPEFLEINNMYCSYMILVVISVHWKREYDIFD